MTRSAMTTRRGHARPTGGRYSLTPAEHQIVRLRLRGWTNGDIAEQLGVKRASVVSMLCRSTWHFNHESVRDMLEDFRINGIPGWPEEEVIERE